MVDLKRCPLCGGYASWHLRSQSRRRFVVGADHDDNCPLGKRTVVEATEAAAGDAWNRYANSPRITELEARAEKAEAERDEMTRVATRVSYDAKAAEANVGRLRAALIEVGRETGAGLADFVSTDFLMGVPNEVKLVLASLRAAGTFNEGIEAGVVAGWNACRRSVYAVCEDIGTEADRNRSDTGNPPRHHFGRGEGDAAKRIARAFNSMEARDDDNTTEALRSLRRPDEGGA